MKLAKAKEELRKFLESLHPGTTCHVYYWGAGWSTHISEVSWSKDNSGASFLDGDTGLFCQAFLRRCENLLADLTWSDTNAIAKKDVKEEKRWIQEMFNWTEEEMKCNL